MKNPEGEGYLIDIDNIVTHLPSPLAAKLWELVASNLSNMLYFLRNGEF